MDDSLAESRQRIGRDDLTGDERRERLEIIDEWEYNSEVRESIQLAISPQSSLTTLGAEPFSGDSPTLSQEG